MAGIRGATMKRRMGDWANGRMGDMRRETQHRTGTRLRPFLLHLLPLLMGIRFSREDAIGWLNLAEIACELHWRRRFNDRISRFDTPLLPRSHPSDRTSGGILCPLYCSHEEAEEAGDYLLL